MADHNPAVLRAIDVIESLSLDDFITLNEWYQEHLHGPRWDAQLERDAASGRLDFLIKDMSGATPLGDGPPDKK